METPEARNKPLSRILRVAAWCLALCAPVVYTIYLLRYAVNVPYWDDIDVILGNLLFHHSGISLQQSLETIFLQHGNEHLTATLQLYALGENALLGEVNFRHMILLGNFFLFLFAGFVLRGSTQPGQRMVFLLPVIPLLFNLHYFEATFWGTVALQLFPAALFAWFSLNQLLKGDNKGLVLSMLLGLVTLQTFGSGVILLPLLALALVMQKRWKHLGIFAGFLALMFLMYFLRFPPMTHQGSKTDALIVYPLHTLHFFLTLAGTGMPVNRFFYWIPGALLALFFIWLTVRRYWRRNMAVYFFLLMVWLTVAAGAVSRAGGGLNEAFAPRYAFNGALLLAFSWIGLMDILKPRLRPVISGAGLVLGLLVCMLHFKNDLPRVKDDFQRRIESIKRYSPGGESLQYSVAEIGAQKMNAAINLGYYHAPNLPPELWQVPEVMLPPEKEDSSLKCVFTHSASLVYSVVLNARIERPAGSPEIQQVYFWLKEGGQNLRIRGDIREHHPSGGSEFYTVESLADSRKMKNGIYTCGVEILEAGGGHAFGWMKYPLAVGRVVESGIVFPVVLETDSLDGRLRISGNLGAYTAHERIFFILSSPDGSSVFEATLPPKTEKGVFTCLKEGGKHFLWLLSDQYGSYPKDNYAASFLVSPDPQSVLDSVTEVNPSPDNAGQKTCYRSFYDVPEKNALSISVASDGIVLRYVDGSLHQILGYYRMTVPKNSRVHLVIENNTPSLYLNGKILYEGKVPLPRQHTFAANFGRDTDRGFSGSLDELRVWSKPLRPESNGNMPSHEEAIFSRTDFEHLEEGQKVISESPTLPDWEMNVGYSDVPSAFWAMVPENVPPNRYAVSIVMTDSQKTVLQITPTEMVVEVK